MLDSHSALADVSPVVLEGFNLAEAPGFTLTQAAGDENELKNYLGELPATIGKVAEVEGRSIFRIAPKQAWILGDPPDSTQEGVYLTPLSSSRTRLLLEGQRARDVLSACAAIDFQADHFKTGQFAMTGIHHTPVLIHCIGQHSFHVYAMRTFAFSVWEWLADAMEGMGA